MSTPIHAALDLLHRAALRRQNATAPDADLLGRYLARRDGDAFEALVRRHGPMVWGVCRRLLPNPQDAEDVFQVVFLVLVQKAASVRPRDRLAAFLFGVARNAALKARRTAGRRRAREKQVQALPEPAARTEGPGRDLASLLDAEVCRLPEKYRVLVILCDLEGKTRSEVARQLGCPEGTVAGRLARARTLLARRLNKHGFPPASAVLITAPVPPALLVSTMKMAAGTGAVPASVAALTQGVFRAMLYTKLKFTLITLLAAAAVIGGGVLLTRPFVPFGEARGAKNDPSSSADAGRKGEPDAPADPAPVTLTYLGQRPGKPPMRLIDVKLEATNPHDYPIWLLTGAYADDKTPPEKGEFLSTFDQPFGGQEYDGAPKGGRGQAVEVHFRGRASFRAFRLPAKATLTFESFPLEAWSDVSEVGFWEVSSLRVNDRTPLEKWLPYPTLCSEKVVIPAGTDWKNLEWDPAKLADRTDYPKEAVKTATATVEKKWIVPIAGIRKGDGE